MEEQSAADLIEYIEKCASTYHLDFVRNAHGEDETAIYLFEDAVQKLTGYYFPTDYFDFLRLMGNQTPIDFADDATMNWKAVWKQYEVWAQEATELSPNCLIVATNGVRHEQLALECRLDDNGDTLSGRVRYAAGGVVQHVLADSFFKYLFSRAFLHCDGRDLTSIATYQGIGGAIESASSLPRVAACIERLGWHTHWFSDSVNLCVTAPNDEMTLFARQREQHAVWMRLAGKNPKYVGQVGEQICAAADLRLEKWW